MKTYTYAFTNSSDGNDVFSVQAANPEEAMQKALEALGWNGPSEGEDEADEDDE